MVIVFIDHLLDRVTNDSKKKYKVKNESKNFLFFIIIGFASFSNHTLFYSLFLINNTLKVYLKRFFLSMLAIPYYVCLFSYTIGNNSLQSLH